MLLGDSGVGKTKIIETLCAGPPDADVMDVTEAATAAAASGGGGGGGGGAGARREQRTWPTVAPKCFYTEVAMPNGAAPVQLEVWDTSGRERFKSLALTFYRRAHSVLLVFDVKDRDSFDSLGAVGGWRDEFTRMTGASPHSFPFMLVGNKAEDDLTADRRVYEEDVRDWCHGDGGIMPYLETSFVGNAADSYKAAQRVFRTLVLAEATTKSNFGRYRPPDTVRVAEEEEEEAGGLQAVDKVLRSLGRLGSEAFHRGQSRRLDSATALWQRQGWPASARGALALQHRGPLGLSAELVFHWDDNNRFKPSTEPGLLSSLSAALEAPLRNAEFTSFDHLGAAEASIGPQGQHRRAPLSRPQAVDLVGLRQLVVFCRHGRWTIGKSRGAGCGRLWLESFEEVVVMGTLLGSW